LNLNRINEHYFSLPTNNSHSKIWSSSGGAAQGWSFSQPHARDDGAEKLHDEPALKQSTNQVGASNSFFYAEH